MNPGMFEDKVALITGASSGIGKTTAVAFANEGAAVVLADLDSENGLAVVRSIEEVGAKAIFVPTDVTSLRDVESLLNESVSTFGKLDFAFNNAGIAVEDRSKLRDTADFEEEAWDRIVNVNLKGVWLSMKHELIQMQKQGFGVIINAASVLGHSGFAGLSPYCASKHGVIGLTQAAALQYAGTGIRINAVCPGLIRSPLVEKLISPFQGMGIPEDVAQAVLWLCSNRSSFINGESIPLSGGLSIY